MRKCGLVLLKIVAYSVLFLLMGCDMKPPPILELHQSQPFPESAKFVNEWLGDGCPQPCWHGIVPGQTHLSEALDILHSIPEINYVDVSSRGEADGGDVHFDVTGGGHRLITGNLIYDSDEEEIIESIRYFAGDSITVQDVIDILGEPSHFIGKAGISDDNNEYYYNVQLFFVEVGVRLEWHGRIPTQNHSLLLEPNQTYLSVTFFEPNSIEASFSGYDEMLQPWPGFGLFEIACSDGTCQLTPITTEE